MNTQGKQGCMAMFDEYPRLGQKLCWTPIGYYPTPVVESSELAAKIGIGRLFIKRDDLTHPLYGGNKVRKLDLLLAEAEQRGARKVMTFGGIGSNHFLATTFHAAQRGIGSIGVLVPQPVTPNVKRNLLCDIHFNAELNLADSYAEIPLTALKATASHMLKDGKPPFIIPAGGSSVAGAVGYVNAAFELKKQIEEGVLPEPDMIFVAVGTCGTAAGLIVGCHAAGLKTRVIGVKVTDWFAANPLALASLANQTAFRLFAADRGFPLRIFTPFNVELMTEYFGGEYGRLTCEGNDAVALCGEFAGVNLEGVYTGKALAGLVGAAAKQDLSDKTVLFWNTYNSADLNHFASEHHYRELPAQFHKFFEMPEHSIDSQ